MILYKDIYILIKLILIQIDFFKLIYNILKIKLIYILLIIFKFNFNINHYKAFEKCRKDKRKTINGDDLIYSFS